MVLTRRAERGQRLGEPVGGRGVDQPLQHDVGRRGAVLERGDDAHQLVPLLGYELEIDDAAQHRIERAVIGVTVDAV